MVIVSYRGRLLAGISAFALFALAAGEASAASNMVWTNFYLSVFGGAASAVGTVDSVAQQTYDPEDWTATTELLSSLGHGAYGGLAIGTEIAPGLRGEVELSTAHLGTSTSWTQDVLDPEAASYFGSSTGSLDASFVLANIWYDVPGQMSFTPYFGGGVGFADLHGSFTASPTNATFDPEGGLFQFDVNQVAPAAQVGFGARMEVAPNITLDVGYRYKGTFGPTPKLSETPSAGGVTVTSSGKGSGNSSWIGVNVFQVGLDFKL